MEDPKSTAKKFDLTKKFKDGNGSDSEEDYHIKKYIDRWWNWNITKVEQIRIVRTATTDDSLPNVIEKKLSIKEVDKRIH